MLRRLSGRRGIMRPLRGCEEPRWFDRELKGFRQGPSLFEASERLKARLVMMSLWPFG